jgi:hypothetical protein
LLLYVRSVILTLEVTSKSHSRIEGPLIRKRPARSWHNI